MKNLSNKGWNYDCGPVRTGRLYINVRYDKNKKLKKLKKLKKTLMKLLRKT